MKIRKTNAHREAMQDRRAGTTLSKVSRSRAHAVAAADKPSIPDICLGSRSCARPGTRLGGPPRPPAAWMHAAELERWASVFPPQHLYIESGNLPASPIRNPVPGRR